MNTRGRNRQLFRMLVRWSLSYIVISVIAVLIISYSSVLYTDEITTELDRINRLQLKNTKSILDGRLEALSRFCEMMNVQNGSVSTLLKTLDISAVTRYRIYEASNSIRIAEVYDDDSSTCLIYYPELDLVVSGSYYADKRYYYDVMLSSDGYSYESFENVLSSAGGKETRIFELGGTPGRQTVALARPLNSSNEYSSRALVVMIFNLSSLLEKNTDLDSSRDNVMIYDRFDGSMISSRPVDAKTAASIASRIDGSESEASLELDDYVVSFVSSSYEYWWYVALTMRQEHIQVLTKLKTIVIAFVILYALVSFLLIFYRTRKIYRPLKDSLDILPKDSSIPQKGGVIDFMTSSINTLKSTNDELDLVVKDQRGMLSVAVKRRLLVEEDAWKALGKEKIAKYGIAVSGFVAVLAVRWEKVSAALTERVRASMSSHSVGGTYSSECSAFMLWSENRENLSESSMSILRETMEYLSKNGIRDISLALSSVHEAPSGYYECYREAQFVFSSQKIKHNPSLVAFSQLNLLPVFMIPDYPASMESRLLDCISKGDGENAVEVVHNIFSRNYEKTLNPESLSLLLSMILGGITKVASREELDATADEERRIMDSRGDISLSEDRLERFIVKLASLKAEEILAKKQSSRSTLSDEIARFIAENYGNAMMNVSFVADHFNMSLSALSSVFNDAGYGKPGQYINLVRLEKARQMIAEGKGLDEVSSVCGWGSLRTFLRVFKQYEGMTPTQYRTLHSVFSEKKE